MKYKKEAKAMPMLPFLHGTHLFGLKFLLKNGIIKHESSYFLRIDFGRRLTWSALAN